MFPNWRLFKRPVITFWCNQVYFSRDTAHVANFMAISFSFMSLPPKKEAHP